MIDARFVIEKIKQPDAAQMLDHQISSDSKAYFNRTYIANCTVPVTSEMMEDVRDVRGVACAGGSAHDCYCFHFTVGMLFEPEVVQRSVHEALLDYAGTLDPETCRPRDDGDDDAEDEPDCPFCRLARQGVRFAVMPFGQIPSM